MKKKISITILTLFPDFLQAYTGFGIIRKAIKHKLLKFSVLNLRGFAPDARGTVDGRPYGGGVGMVLRADVILNALKLLKSKITPRLARGALSASRTGKNQKSKIILLTPQGKTFQQADASRLAKYEHLIFISGRYEGFDERVRKFADEEISIGDYVLMGGELPALAVSEAILRLIPGVLGKHESTREESFAARLLEYPQYTKPEVLKIRAKGTGLRAKEKVLRVPRVLLSGNHQKINQWRTQEAVKRTKQRRPDLLK